MVMSWNEIESARQKRDSHQVYLCNERICIHDKYYMTCHCLVNTCANHFVKCPAKQHMSFDEQAEKIAKTYP